MSTARKVFASIGALITLAGLGTVVKNLNCTEFQCLMIAFGWYAAGAGAIILAASTIRFRRKAGHQR